MALPNGQGQQTAAAAAATAADFDEEAWGPAPAAARALPGPGGGWQQARAGGPPGGMPGWQQPAAAAAAAASTFGMPGRLGAGGYGGGPPWPGLTQRPPAVLGPPQAMAAGTSKTRLPAVKDPPPMWTGDKPQDLEKHKRYTRAWAYEHEDSDPSKVAMRLWRQGFPESGTCRLLVDAIRESTLISPSGVEAIITVLDRAYRGCRRHVEEDTFGSSCTEQAAHPAKA